MSELKQSQPVNYVPHDRQSVLAVTVETVIHTTVQVIDDKHQVEKLKSWKDQAAKYVRISSTEPRLQGDHDRIGITLLQELKQRSCLARATFPR